MPFSKSPAAFSEQFSGRAGAPASPSSEVSETLSITAFYITVVSTTNSGSMVGTWTAFSWVFETGNEKVEAGTENVDT